MNFSIKKPAEDCSSYMYNIGYSNGSANRIPVFTVNVFWFYKCFVLIVKRKQWQWNNNYMVI